MKLKQTYIAIMFVTTLRMIQLMLLKLNDKDTYQTSIYIIIITHNYNYNIIG